MLDYALHYASLGWHVFPIHSVKDGICSCHAGLSCDHKGKHPVTSNGFNSATTNTVLIRQWWGMWDYANIGVATGAKSGFIVIDIDLGGEDSITEPLPHTVCQTTGSGGSHHLFKYPNDGIKYKSASNLLTKVDSRADGGYIVIAPSNHKSGGEYSWDIAPDEAPLADAPQWWLSLIRVVDRDISMAERPEWNPDGELPEQIHEMLEAIKDKSDSYDEWIKVGMALHYADPSADGFKVWDWWSGLSPKYDSQSVRREWNNFSRRGHMTSLPITIDSVRSWARDSGWVDKWLEHGKQQGENILESHLKSQQMKIAEKLMENSKPIELNSPVNIFPKRGLIKEIADFIIETSQYEQPELAIGAAIALVGAVAGRKYTTYTGASTCLYIMGVADTSAGKGHAIRVLNRILFKIGMQDIVSGEPASGSAMYSALRESPNKFYLLDEVGDFFGRIMSAKASGHEKEIKSELLKFFSEASEGGMIKGKDKANRELNKTIAIHSPSVMIYGATTGETFYKSLNGGQIRDGLLSRITLIDSGDNKPLAKKRITKEIPKYIIDKLNIIKSFGVGNLAGVVPVEIDIPKFYDVKIDDDVDNDILDFTHHVDRLRNIAGAPAELYGRTSEVAVRLALIYAISVDAINPIIDSEAWEWGREVSLWCTNTIITQSRDYVSDGEYDAKLKMVLNVIRKKGKDGIPLGKMGVSTKLPPKERSEIVKDLEERGDIVSILDLGTGGRPKTVLYYTGD